MDELVYLFELDSVRSTPEEILRGQRAMFREVALKGNRVVLTFNQLTDSHGFLCAVGERLWEQVAAQGSPNRRSDWYAALRRDRGDWQARAMAEAVVDLCYNYTMAGSILGLEDCLGSGNGFPPGFLERLANYWADGQAGIHRFLRPDGIEGAPSPAAALPHWDTAVRLLESVPAAGGSWRRRMILSRLRQVGSVALYLLLFLVTTLFLDGVESGVTALGQRGRINEVVLALGNIVLFGMAGSLLSWWLRLPDILDSVRQLGHTVRDGFRLFRAGRWGRGTGE